MRKKFQEFLGLNDMRFRIQFFSDIRKTALLPSASPYLYFFNRIGLYILQQNIVQIRQTIIGRYSRVIGRGNTNDVFKPRPDKALYIEVHEARNTGKNTYDSIFGAGHFFQSAFYPAQIAKDDFGIRQLISPIFSACGKFYLSGIKTTFPYSDYQNV